MVKVAGLIHGELNHPLRTGGKAYLSGRGLLPPADDELYGSPHLVEVNAQIGEDPGSHTLALPHQSQ
jgi:hydroxylamine reductase (hybrid-cluster protein)